MDSDKEHRKSKRIHPVLAAPALLALVVISVPILVGMFFWYLFRYYKSFYYGLLVRLKWHPKYILFIYSNPEHSRDYMEANILPKISESAVVLNWGERSQWPWSKTLALKVFRHWAEVGRHTYTDKDNKKRQTWTGYDFSPMAIVFNPWWHPKVIRFWDAFRKYKRGRDSELKRRERELFASLRTSG